VSSERAAILEAALRPVVGRGPSPERRRDRRPDRQVAGPALDPEVAAAVATVAAAAAVAVAVAAASGMPASAAATAGI